ncbi:hypothetical protein QC758_09500 [Halomonas campisalis]|nr:hypothetical protein [Halomonas campisalis]MDR5863194.1 hypothetical protein [Halomonas campisalis]
MASHATQHEHRPRYIPACQRCGLAILLSLLLALLLGSSASAHLTTPGHGGHSAFDHPLALESFDGTLPHCQHGHGAPATSHAILRAERQELDHDATPPRFTPPETPPSVPAVTGMPRGLPDVLQPPLYLLTQRLRP